MGADGLCHLDTQSGNISVDDSYNKFHDYEIQWTPDEIKWLVDGKVGRVKKRADTWNATSNQWNFPQTPSRVQISIWPGGLETNAKGTIDWAGGKIDWNSEEIKNYGYYFATFGEIKVECYKTNSPPGTNKGISYYYSDISATNNTVVDGNKPTTIKSLLATGLDTTKGDPAKDNGAAQSSAVHAVPGGGVGAGVIPGADKNESSDSGSGSNGSGSSSAANECSKTGFSQSCDDSAGQTKGSDAVRVGGLGASALAAFISIAGLLLL